MSEPVDTRPAAPNGAHECTHSSMTIGGTLSPIEIRVEGLHKSFRTAHVLRGINLDIREGELIAIVGGSGSGKTVLLNHMTGLMKPDRGRVLIADPSGPASHPHLIDLAEADESTMERIRVNWAIVFQRNALFSGTVLQNIALWLREIKRMREDQIRAIAVDALNSVGFSDPEALLTKDRDELSGGMAKRVAIARALAMDPEIIFYDEPTTGLDPTLSGQIHELIDLVHRRARSRTDHGAQIQRTSVVVTHDKDLLRRLRPRIVMLHEGRVFFDGPFDAFERCDSPIVRPYFDMMIALHQRPYPAS